MKVRTFTFGRVNGCLDYGEPVYCILSVLCCRRITLFDVFDPELGENGAAVVILDHRIADVDTPACPDIFIEFRLLERNGRDHRIGLLSLNQIHLEVFPFGTDQPRIAPVAHIPCDEYRRGIARAERLETG